MDSAISRSLLPYILSIPANLEATRAVGPADSKPLNYDYTTFESYTKDFKIKRIGRGNQGTQRATNGPAEQTARDRWTQFPARAVKIRTTQKDIRRSG